MAIYPGKHRSLNRPVEQDMRSPAVKRPAKKAPGRPKPPPPEGAEVARRREASERKKRHLSPEA